MADKVLFDIPVASLVSAAGDMSEKKKQAASQGTVPNQKNHFHDTNYRTTRYNGMVDYLNSGNTDYDTTKSYLDEANGYARSVQSDEERDYWTRMANGLLQVSYADNNKRKSATQAKIDDLDAQIETLRNNSNAAPLPGSTPAGNMVVTTPYGAMNINVPTKDSDEITELVRQRDALAEELASYGDNTSPEVEEAIGRLKGPRRNYTKLAKQKIETNKTRLAEIETELAGNITAEKRTQLEEEQNRLTNENVTLAYNPDSLREADQELVDNFNLRWNSGARNYTVMDDVQDAVNAITLGVGSSLLNIAGTAAEGMAIDSEFSMATLAGKLAAEDGVTLDENNLDEYMGKARTMYEEERAKRGMLERKRNTLNTMADTAEAMGLTDLAEEYRSNADAIVTGPIEINGVREQKTKLTDIANWMQGASDTLKASADEHTAKAQAGKGEVGQFVIDLGINAGQMAFDHTIGILTGTEGAALAMMAARVFGESAGEARREGATHSQQVGYGVANAGIEYVTEKMFGVFDHFGYGKGFTGGWVEKGIADLARTPAGRSTLRVLAQLGGEGMEEVASDLLHPFAEMIYKDGTWEELSEDERAHLFQSFLSGAALALFSSAGGVVSGQNSAATAQSYIDEVTMLAPELAAKQAAGTPLTARDTRNMNRVQNATDRITAMAGTFSGAGSYLNARLTGADTAGTDVFAGVTPEALAGAGPAVRKGARALLNSEDAREGLEDILTDVSDIVLGTETGEPLDWSPEMSDSAVGYVTYVLTNGLAGGRMYDAASRAALAQEAVEFAQSGLTIEQAAQAAMENTRDSVVIKPGPETAEAEAPAPVQAQAEEDAGTMERVDRIVAEEEEKQKAAPRQQDVVDILTEGAVSNKQADRIGKDPAMMKAFREATGIDLSGMTSSEKRAAIRDAAAARARAASETALDDIINEVKGYEASETDAAEILAETARGESQSRGQADTLRESENAKSESLTAKNGRRTGIPQGAKAESLKRGDGKVSYDGATVEGETYAAVDTSKLTDRQKAQIRAMGAVAEATGVNVVFYQSGQNEKGQYVGANGFYLDGTVYLDINAGLESMTEDGRTVGEVAMVRTAAHELTHFIRETSEKDYQALQDFVVKTLTDRVGAEGLESLIREKQERAGGEDRLSHEDALEEVVADGCEMMLRDSKAIKRLAVQNKSLAKRIRDWIRNFVDSIREAFDGIGAAHTEARILMREAEKLQKLWDDALFNAVITAESDTEFNMQNERYVAYSMRDDMTEPKKTQYGFKLMNVDENGLPHAMFIDAGKPYEYNKWYAAQAPGLDALLDLEPGYAYLVDADENIDVKNRKPVRKVDGSFRGLPSKRAVNDATSDGKRWMVVDQYANGQKSIHNVGINGSGGISTFAMRPGIHAVDIPSMKHIGAKSEGSSKIDTRRPDQRWFLIEYPVDNDYNQEAFNNPKKDIPDHLPVNGWYSFQTNSGAEAKQHWFITGGMKIIGPVAETDVRKYANDRGFEEDLPWKLGKDYTEDNALDLEKYMRETKALPTPSKQEMYDRITAEAEKESKRAPDAQNVNEEAFAIVDGKTEPISKYSLRSMKHDMAEGKMFEDLAKYTDMTDTEIDNLRKGLDDLVEFIATGKKGDVEWRDFLDLNEGYGKDDRPFKAYKPNSDPLYTISLDFSTLCRKRLMTQYVIEKLQTELKDTETGKTGRALSAEEQLAVRDMLNEYRQQEKALKVACAMCYVEAARLKAPGQINKFMRDPSTAMLRYFALKNKEFNASVKQAQADFKEAHGYARNVAKKDMKPSHVTAMNKMSDRLRSTYGDKAHPASAEEMEAIRIAKTLPNTTYLTAANLAKLAEEHPVIYDAYTYTIRAATRSKSLEADVPYYYGDSQGEVTDDFIRKINAENGMRFSSWSDFQIQHMLDMMTAVIELSTRGAAMHGYTKFLEQVRIFGKTGMMFNMSGVPQGTGLKADGSLDFSPTESVLVKSEDGSEYDAIKARNDFPETAGLQCIGISNEHIKALMASDIIDYIIPYHTSGLNATLRRMAKISDWKDFTSFQNASEDKSIKFDKDVHNKDTWHKEPVFSEFFNEAKNPNSRYVEKKENAYRENEPGIVTMRRAADIYKQMCKERGMRPKFSWGNSKVDADFSNDPNYWKLLIDRKMINQKNGKLIEQKPVRPNFEFGEIKKRVQDEVDAYDPTLQDRALAYVREHLDELPQRIAELKKKGAVKKAKADSKKNRELSKKFSELQAGIVAAATEGSVKEGAKPKKAKKSDREYGERSPQEIDAEYQEALDAKDADWQMMLVNEAAYNAGYTSGAYHGSPVTDITSFNTRSTGTKPEKMQLLFGTHFTRNKSYAEIYTKKAKSSKGTSRMSYSSKPGRVYNVYLDLGKSLDIAKAENFTPGSEIYSLYEDFPEKIRKKVPAHQFTEYETALGMGSGKYINSGDIETALQMMAPKDAVEFLSDHGYNSVLYTARYNQGSWDNNRFAKDESIIMLDPERIKSGDPITYDDDGNIIPPSKRFDRGSSDIRFQLRENGAWTPPARENTQAPETEAAPETETAPEQVPAQAPQGNPFFPNEPVPAPKAPGVTREKVSQFFSNTLRESGRDEGLDPVTYNPTSEAESLARAAMRMSGDRQELLGELMQAKTWTNEMVDAAWMIENEFYKEYVRTGDSTNWDNWRRIETQKISETAKGLQAVAKQSRPGAAGVLNAAMAEIDSVREENAKAEKAGRKAGTVKEEVLTAAESKIRDAAYRMAQLEAEVDDAVAEGRSEEEAEEAVKDRYLDLISDINLFRNVGLFQDTALRSKAERTGRKFRKMLAKQDMAYIKRYAACAAAGIAEDVHYSGKQDIRKRLNTWQKLAQLTGTGTWLRNGVGNGSFGIVDVLSADNPLTWLTDAILSKKTGVRSSGVEWGILNGKARQAAHQALERSILEVAGNIDLATDRDSTKYDMARTRTFDPDGSTAERLMSRWEQWNGYMLQSSDAWFKGAAEGSVRDALIRANGWDAENLTAEQEKQIDETARQVAEYRTFQNNGAAAQAANELRDLLNRGGARAVGREWKQGQFGLGTAIMPYTKVPTNLGVKSLEFSPLGMAKGLAEIARVAGDKNATMAQQNKAVTDFGRGVTGTMAIWLLAKLMRALPWFKDWENEDDKDVIAQNRAEGKYGIQMNLSMLKRFADGDRSGEWRTGDRTIDISSMEPVNQLLTTASLIADGMPAWKAIGKSSLDNLKNIPSVSTLANIEDTIRYSTAETAGEKALEVAASMAGSVAGGMIPAPLRHIASVTDEYARDTSGNGAVERALNQAKSSIPGLRQTLPEKVDAFGNKVSAGDLRSRIGNAYDAFKHTQVNQTAESAEVAALMAATGEKLLPSRNAPGSVTYGSGSAQEKVQLTADEKREYKVERGQTYEEAVRQMMDSPIYRQADDDTKAEMLKTLLSYATDEAKTGLADERGISYDGQYDEVRQLQDPFGYLTLKTGYSTWDASGNWTNVDRLIREAQQMDAGTRAYAMEHVDGFGSLYDIMQEGLSGSEAWNRFRTGSKARAEARGSSAANGADILAEVVNGRYSNSDADILMGRQKADGSYHAGKGRHAVYQAMRENNFTPQQAAEFWAAVDVNGNGTVTKKEFNAALKLLNADYRQAVSDAFWRIYDGE